jgi:uncharacterized damage-inducible protein DinB
MAPIVADLFKHNPWANLRLVDACATLSEDHLSASAPGTYGGVRDTLVHMLASEGRYVAEFTKRTEAGALSEDLPFPGFGAVRKHAAASGETLISLAERMRPSRLLRGTYRGQPYVMRGALLMAQAINHAAEHRAHIVSILSQRDVQTPRLDAIAYFQEGER